MGVNCQASLQTLNVSGDMKWTTNTHVTPFTFTFEAQLTISMVLEDFLLLNFCNLPVFLPVQNGVLPIQMTGGQISA